MADDDERFGAEGACADETIGREKYIRMMRGRCHITQRTRRFIASRIGLSAGMNLRLLGSMYRSCHYESVRAKSVFGRILSPVADVCRSRENVLVFSRKNPMRNTL